MPLVFFLLSAFPSHAQTEILISNYSQPLLLPNQDLTSQSVVIAWDFTTGATDYNVTQLNLMANNNDGVSHTINARFFTSLAGVPDALVGTLSVPVSLTEPFLDFSSDPGSVLLHANTTYWIVASLGEPLLGANDIRLPSMDGTLDAGGVYSANGGTTLLLSNDGGTTWTTNPGVDSVLYMLQGAAVATVNIPNALLTAQSLQSAAFQNTAQMLEDFALRLFRTRSGQNGAIGGNAIVINRGAEDELVEIGQGDGDPQKVGFSQHTSGSGQLLLFSSVDYGYARLNSSLAAQRTDSYAGNLGLEYRFSPRLAVGGGFSALTARSKLTGGVANVDTSGFTLVTYANFNHGGAYLDLLYAASLLDHSLTRSTGTGSVTASPHATVHNVQLNVGHNLTHGALIHGPFATVNYAHASTDGYNESGVGGLNVASQSSDSILGRLGWQVSSQLKRDWGTLIPQLRLSWDNQFLNSAGGTGVSVPGFAGLSTRTGAYAARQSGLGVGAGVMLQINSDWRIACNYQGHMLDRGANIHNVSAFVSFSW